MKEGFKTSEFTALVLLILQPVLMQFAGGLITLQSFGVTAAVALIGWLAFSLFFAEYYLPVLPFMYVNLTSFFPWPLPSF